jgi:ABC-type nickel/cobalt efflux system permease component RcnA
MSAFDPNAVVAGLDFTLLSTPLDRVDAGLTGLFDGAPLLVALGIAFALGLRHASDPDHLVAVTSLVAANDADARDATRLGVWWGLGHAITLALIGLPLIALNSRLPAWLEGGAEKAVGLVIMALAFRVIWKWSRGEYRAGPHGHAASADARSEAPHRRVRRGRDPGHRHPGVRTPRQALGIGFLHGLAGTGAVVLLLLSSLPSRLEAALSLAIFAPMTLCSMAACTTAFAWVLTRPSIQPVYRGAVIPALGLFGLVFGLWYAGIG